MKTFKLLIVISLFIFCYQTTKAQTTINDVERLRFQTVLKEKQKTTGYFSVYTSEKKNKEFAVFNCLLFDDKYVVKKQFELLRPKGSFLIDVVFNGSHLLLFFADRKNTEIIITDKTGNETGRLLKPLKDYNSFTKQAIKAKSDPFDTDLRIFESAGESGFICNGYSKEGKGLFEIMAISNEAKVIWTVSEKEKETVRAGAEIVAITKNMIILNVLKIKSVFRNGSDGDLLVLDKISGKTLFTDSLIGPNKEKLSPTNAFYNPVKKTLLITGEFFDTFENILKDFSQGMFMLEVNESGSRQKLKLHTWQEGINKLKPNANKEPDPADEGKIKSKKPMKFFIHEVMISKNGAVSFIAEEMKRGISDEGLALNMLTSYGNISSIEITLGNIMIMHFKDNFELKKIEVIDKKKHGAFLQKGMEFMPTRDICLWLKDQQQFDFLFYIQDEKSEDFKIIFRDAERKENETKLNSNIGISTIKKGIIKTTLIPFQATEGNTWFTIRESNAGAIGVTEFFRKEKKLTFRTYPIVF